MDKSIRKNFCFLALGNIISKLGNITFDYINNMWFVNNFFSKSIFLAIYQSSDTVVSIIFNIFGGALADKSNKKKILIITDLISAIICFLLGILTKNKNLAYFLIFGNIVLSILSSFNYPTYKSIALNTLTQNITNTFNSVLNISGEFIRIIGPIFSIFLFNSIGIKAAMILNCISFLLSALLEMKLIIIKEFNESRLVGKKFFDDDNNYKRRFFIFTRT
ncbi:MFS transporter [Defluviitalea phaphyphila]|uniref:MFS transporter n=1 Tax=Defluviitalea phaphyphila TaxID=1473580 RepID=UPI0007308B88|nr:MFS transporter [Defluviitalea phaphyphila]